MSETKKTKLGDAIFSTIDDNDFLNVLYDNMLYNYALLKLHLQGFQQERQVERDWNEITSVCLTLQFPEIDAAIGKAQIDLIGREKTFFDLERFNASLYAADSTLMADTKTAKLSYGACDGPCIEFPFWYIPKAL